MYNTYLIHYGVPGMKWGVKKAREEYRAAKRQERRDTRWAFGQKRIDISNESSKATNKAYAKLIEEKAKYNASKAKNKTKAEAAELKTYVKAYGKHGLAGSAADTKGRSAALRDHLIKKKGSEYTNKVITKTENKYIAQIVGGVTVAAGSAAILSILKSTD